MRTKPSETCFSSGAHNRFLNRSLASGIILACVLVFIFRDGLLKGWILAVPGDVTDQFLPWRIFTVQELAEGRIPLWNRYSFCGAPFLANMQSAVLYPVDRLLDLLFNPPRSLMTGLMLHLWFGGVCLFFLAKKAGASSSGAFVSAMGFSLGGFHAIHVWGGNLLTITSSVYLPGHLWALLVLAERVEKNGKITSIFVWIVLLDVLQILSGHAQMVFYNALFVAVFAIGLLARMRTGRIRFCCLLTLAGIFSVCIASAQLLPTLEYSKYSSRTGVLPYPQATEFSFGWEGLLSFVLPEYLGTRADLNSAAAADTYWGDWKNWSGVYLGILPATGFLYLLVTPRHPLERRKVFGRWGALLGFALVLALGRNTPIYYWIHHEVPLFGKFRAPSKFLPGVVVPVAVIGAVGLSRLHSDMVHVKTRWLQHGAVNWGRFALLLGGSGLCSVAFFTPFSHAQVPTTLIQRDLIRSVSLLLLCLGGSSLVLGNKSGVGWKLGAVFVLVTIIDMTWYFEKYVFTAPVESAVKFRAEKIREHLRKGERFLATEEVPQTAFCIPERIPSVGGYDPFQVKWFVETFRKEGVLPKDMIPDSWSPPVSWAQRLGVGVVLSSRVHRNPEVVPVEKYVYRIQNPAPFVEVDETVAGKGRDVPWRWKGSDLVVEGPFPPETTLLIRETYFPGWVARDQDGELFDVRRSPPFWQKVKLKDGADSVVLHFEPVGWKMGKQVTILGLIFLGPVSFLVRRFEKKWSRSLPE